jgi:hypothetical protein
VTELALETAPRWPPDRPAIQGPPRIDFERADAPPACARWCLGPYIRHLVWEETKPGRHNDPAHGARLSFFTPQGHKAIFKTDCGGLTTRGNRAERASHQRFRVAAVPLSSRGFPASCGPNVAHRAGYVRRQ